MGFNMGRDHLSPYFFGEVVSDAFYLLPVNGGAAHLISSPWGGWGL